MVCVGIRIEGSRSQSHSQNLTLAVCDGILRLMPMAVVVLKTSSTLRGSEVGLCKAGDLLLIDNEKGFAWSTEL